MIGVDTNILARVLVPDSPTETETALAFFAARSHEDPAYVSVIVLVELVWVLKRSYGFSAEAAFAALESLFDSSNIRIEKADLIQLAVEQAQIQRADIADCLIAAVAADAGASNTVTFDRDAAKRVPGMDLLA